MCQTCNSVMDEYNGDGRPIISFVAISIYITGLYSRGERSSRTLAAVRQSRVLHPGEMLRKTFSDFICFPANRIFQQFVCFRTSSKSLVTFSSGAPGTGGGGKPVARVSPGNI